LVQAKAARRTTRLLALERTQEELRAGQSDIYSLVAGKAKWKLRLFAAILLAPFIAQAQMDRPLPDAPSDVSAAGASGIALDSPAEAAQAGNDFVPVSKSLVFESKPAAEASGHESSLDGAVEGVHLNLNPLFAAMNRPAPSNSVEAGSQDSDRYHLQGLLWQSLAFIGIEDSFRLLTDPYMRHLIADGPYWHNYMASMGQWNMRRWSDGDDFLVDDIAHPMQGATSAFIEIQNSPRQRSLRIGSSREYWRSRFLGMMWATVFSTQQKIGPLGEAAVGSAGGYTYVQNCASPCPTYIPGKTKYTNNTGWTDFIITPTVGTLWVMMEDFLDLKVSDRVQRGNIHALFPKILRGSLNPTRTMANALRWRAPWYRDFQEDGSNQHITGGIHFLPSDEAVVRSAPRYEIFPHYNAISLPVNTVSCSHCRQMTSGYGVGFAVRLARWVDFDSDLDYQPNASPLPSDRAGGDITMGTFGLRSGVQYTHFALKASIRPGFLSYNHAYETSPAGSGPTPDIGRITHFATALAINGDYIVTRRFALRAVIGNTPVRYREPYLTGPPGAGAPPYLNWLSHEVFLTNENWTCQTGAVLRF
jgi:hypothetical protein